VREAVEAGAGATIISEHVVASAVAAGKLHAIPIDLPPRDFTLVRHRARHLGFAPSVLFEHLVASRGAAVTAPSGSRVRATHSGAS
jgi:DNA-binding transcriptional LysR family regulator